MLVILYTNWFHPLGATALPTLVLISYFNKVSTTVRLICFSTTHTNSCIACTIVDCTCRSRGRGGRGKRRKTRGREKGKREKERGVREKRTDKQTQKLS